VTGLDTAPDATRAVVAIIVFGRADPDPAQPSDLRGRGKNRQARTARWQALGLRTTSAKLNTGLTVQAIGALSRHGAAQVQISLSGRLYRRLRPTHGVAPQWRLVAE